jgi:hypothetical protein
VGRGGSQDRSGGGPILGRGVRVLDTVVARVRGRSGPHRPDQPLWLLSRLAHTERDGKTVDEALYGQVEHWRDADGLSTRERLSAEYAERFAIDHLGLDDDEDFWVRMRGAYTDNEVIELSMCIGSWIAFGRLNHVLGIDAACALPAH